MSWWSKLKFVVGGVFAAMTLNACSEPQQVTSAHTVTVRIVHGPELRAYLSTIKEQFYLTNPTLKDGTKVALEFIPDLGVPTAKHIASGETKADGWLAPSSALVSLANSSVRNLGAHQIECKQLFGSPVVIAIPPALESSIGAHDQQFTWKEVTNSATTHRDDMTLRYSHADPYISVSGLSALIQLAHFAAKAEGKDGKGSPTQEAIVWNDALASNLRDFESRISQYSYSESYLLERSALSIPRRIRFTVTTEQQVALYNRNRGGKSPALVALYPAHDAVWQDYSLCRSDAAWMTAEQVAGIQLVQEFLGTEVAQSSVADHGFRPSISRKADLSVLGPHLGVNVALPKQSAAPIEVSLVEKLLATWEEIIRPVAIVVIVDSSGSMEGDALRGTRDGARDFLARLPARTKAALVTFTGTPVLAAPFTEDRAAIIPELDNLQPQGGSAAYDALKFGVDILSAPELDKYRRAVLMITDGEGKSSEITQQMLSSYLDQKVFREDLNIMIVALKRGDANYSDLIEISKNADAVFRETSIGELQGLLQDLLKSL